MTTNKNQNCIGLDLIDFNEQEILLNWEHIMPLSVAGVYIPISCIEVSTDRLRFLVKHAITDKMAVAVCAREMQKGILHAEADVMDILVLDCMPRKIAYFEGERTAVLVRDYLVGESIQGVVTRKGVFDEDSARELGKGLCEMIAELYERNLTVDTSSLKAGNIFLVPDENMKFVEPEGISYCANVTENWAATEQAIGQILKFMLAGEGKSIPAGKISAEFAKVLERSTGATSEGYKSVTEFRQALEATSPGLLLRRKLAKGMIFVAVLLAFLIIITPYIHRFGKGLGWNHKNSTEGQPTPTVEVTATEAPSPTATPVPGEQ